MAMTKYPVGTSTWPLTRALVDAQFGEWSDLTIEEVPAGGTVNAIFRLGDGLVARFWLEADDLEETRSELLTEVEAARELAGKTRFATPTPVAVGNPGEGYPLPWLVHMRIEGDVATGEDISGSPVSP